MKRASVFLFSLLVLGISFAQKQSESEETPRFYLRKSISYYDGILIGKNVTIDDNTLNRILTRLHKTLSMERFDFNPIPTNLQQNLQTEISNLDLLTLDNLSNAIERTFVPEIVKILNIVQTSRTKTFVSEQERANFLTSKAKEVGVTADDIEKVMNAAYIYVPFITSYSVAQVGDKAIVKLDGGIIWYNVATSFAPPKVASVAKKSTRSVGMAKAGRTYTDITTRKQIDAVQFATNAATKAFLRNIEVITKEIPEFRLSADVFSVSGGRMLFKLGKKEGIRVDDKFNVVEFYEDEDGIRRPQTVGCVLVSDVVNNKDTKKTEIVYSSAKNIVGSAEPGMTLLERPRLPIDVLVGYASFPNNKWGLNVEFDYNMGRYFGIPQLYLPISLLVFQSSSGGVTQAGLNELGAGLIKKFYWKRFSFGVEGWGKMDLNTNEFRPEAEGLLEFRLMPDIVLGGKGGYSFGNNQGLTWGVRLGYNPPTLPFDPFETLRGLMGI